MVFGAAGSAPKILVHSKMTAFWENGPFGDRTCCSLKQFQKTLIGSKSTGTRASKDRPSATDAERDHLLEQAELAGLKIEPFVRNVILGVQMKPRPKEEWAELLRQTSGIANNINQITRRMNSGEPIREETLQLIADMQAQIWEKLKEF